MDKSRNADDVAAELGIRPLNARSVVLSALLGTHPPELPVAALVELAAEFGIAAGTVRTALSRMVAAGDVTSVDGRYRLSGRLVDRQREQDAGRIAPASEWDGTWWSVVVSGGGSSVADRRRLRSTMAGARLGELRAGVWMRPANIDLGLGLPGVVVVRGAVTAGDESALVTRLWDLVALEAKAVRLGGALRRSVDALDAATDGTIAPAFTTMAACLQFLRTEPQLPPALARSGASQALRADYARAEPLLQSRLRELSRPRDPSATDQPSA